VSGDFTGASSPADGITHLTFYPASPSASSHVAIAQVINAVDLVAAVEYWSDTEIRVRTFHRATGVLTNCAIAVALFDCAPAV
jgi:hypothetical protein